MLTPEQHLTLAEAIAAEPRVIVEAPAKLNLCLYVGPVRGRRPARDLLAVRAARRSRIELTIVGCADEDEVVVPDGARSRARPDRAGARRAARGRVGRAASVRIEVEKEIPVAAGLGGGSADAAAVLRLAAARPAAGAAPRDRAGRSAPTSPRSCGPRFCLVGGAGEELTDLRAPFPFPVVVVADPEGLSTPEVYAEADRLGTTRSAAELEELTSRRCWPRPAAAAHPLDYARPAGQRSRGGGDLAPPVARGHARRARGGGRRPRDRHRLRPDRDRHLPGLAAGRGGCRRAGRERLDPEGSRGRSSARRGGPDGDAEGPPAAGSRSSASSWRSSSPTS